MDTVFHDLPASAFPFTIRMFRVSDDVEVWTETVAEPGALHIPALAKEHGPVRTRVEFASGDSQEWAP